VDFQVQTSTARILLPANASALLHGAIDEGQPPATANKRLAEQTRKILGKHYASKYRVR
jgi:hypothetical protein